MDDIQTPALPIWQRLRRIATKLVVIVGLIWAVKLGVDALTAKIALLETDAAARTMTGMIVIVMLSYAILLSVPFVPGIEIGLALLVVQGADAAPYVYVATVTGLFLAFLVGQYAPLHRLIQLCNDFYLHRLGALLDGGGQNAPRPAACSNASTHARLACTRLMQLPLCDARADH